MNKNITLLLSLFCLLSTSLLGQTSISFKYDNAGNRNKRIIDFKSEQISGNDGWQSPQNEKISNMEILIYPNPTKGILRIDIKNLNENSKGEIKVFDIMGKNILHIDKITPENVVNLQYLRNGTYVLQLSVGDSLSEWKILKN